MPCPGPSPDPSGSCAEIHSARMRGLSSAEAFAAPGAREGALHQASRSDLWEAAWPASAGGTDTVGSGVGLLAALTLLCGCGSEIGPQSSGRKRLWAPVDRRAASARPASATINASAANAYTPAQHRSWEARAFASRCRSARIEQSRAACASLRDLNSAADSKSYPSTRNRHGMQCAWRAGQGDG